MSCSGSLKKGRFGYQWQAALALVGPIYDTSAESKDGCKKMRLVTIRAPNAVAIGHSLNLKGSTDSSGKKH